MDRQPGSLHGIEPVPATEVSRTMPCWRAYSGAYRGEADFDTETEVVPYAADWAPTAVSERMPARSDDIVRDRNGLRLFDTRAMA